MCSVLTYGVNRQRVKPGDVGVVKRPGARGSATNRSLAELG